MFKIIRTRNSCWKNKCVKKEGRTRKDREKKRVLESFFLDHLLYKILGLKNLQQNLFAKKVKKKNCKSLLPLNLKKCIMVKTWATYAPWFHHNYLNDNKMLSWSCNDTHISWIPWIGNYFHLFGYFWARNTAYVVNTCHENLMINLCLGIYLFAH